MDVKISTLEQLKSLIKDKTLQSRSNILIEGLSINEADLEELNYLDPKVLNFNNCNFKEDINFDGIFGGSIGLKELIITNSHLTDQQGHWIICALSTENLQYLDFSNNDLGQKTQNSKKSFLERFIENYPRYSHLRSIKLVNNGFSEDERTKLLSLFRDKTSNIEM